MRKTIFSTEEYYHIYNRGVDKRSLFEDKKDLERFIVALNMLNTTDLVGSIRNKIVPHSYRSSTPVRMDVGNNKLVECIAYCINQNHYHLILTPLVEQGVQKFMHRLATSYTNYFNEKHKRSGALFQGRYKAVHIETNEYLLHLSVYVNLNDKVHKNMNKAWFKKVPYSSFEQYRNGRAVGGIFCNTSIVLSQFKSPKEYVHYAEKALPEILKKKEKVKEISTFLLE